MRLLAIFLLTSSVLCYSDYSLKDGKLVERQVFANPSVQEQYNHIMNALGNMDWKRLEREVFFIKKNFPDSHYSKDASYFLGIAYYHQEDFETANLHFTDYLTHQSTPKYFEQAIRHKFQIAENFRGGARKHIMGLKGMPKWAGAGTESISIYDEVISALPHHDLAARAIYGKAEVLAKNEDFRAAIESYQTLIRRFPKHPLAIESYIGIGQVYLTQSRTEYPDPDFLDLAELNLRKFHASFPGEVKVATAQQNYIRMQEHYANSLYDTARFYERTNKWGAAKIYYTKILKSYPECSFSPKSKERLGVVEIKLTQLETKKNKK